MSNGMAFLIATAVASGAVYALDLYFYNGRNLATTLEILWKMRVALRL
jgi:hypothetical protein